MKKKIICLFICIFLVGTITQVHGANTINNDLIILESNTHKPPIFNQKIYDEENDNIVPLGRSDFGFLGIEFTGWTPPDPIIAAGPNHLAVMTNGAIGFFQKDGTKDFQDEIEDSFGFWGNEGATGFVFDPEVIYDPHTDRFMAMACERAPNSRSYYLLAVSDDSDPNGDWHKYRIDVTTEGGGGDIDSPNIAVDSEAVYLSADFFTGGQKYLVYILEKEPLLSGTIGVTKSMLITGSQSFGIPVTYGNPPAMYMIEHFEDPSNTIVRLHAITDPLGTPDRETYDLTVPAYSPPEDPPQKGTGVRPETFDSRFWSCVWRDGSLWATHHQGTSRVMARWYEIKTNDWPTSGTPELYQSGDIDPGEEIRTFFTSIAPDGYGNAAMCFARSSPDEYISMARCLRLADDPLGTMGPVVIVKESDGPYSSYRWGDYSGVSCDPSDNLTFWMMHEWTPGDGTWNTWISNCSGEFPNNPPEIPTIDGPTSGNAETPYNYTFNSVDPDDDDVYYYIKWGDGYIESWDGPHPSGEDFEISHTYANEGSFTIEAKAKDSEGYESGWATLNVTMPRTKPSFFKFDLLNWLFERYPILLQTLRFLPRFH
ncbi:MAG: PKD domain-containing protein [Thermoplasmatales archaeon]|nr:MAG: PKD domain-containing protein [Thermoplasmatales archaeon]